MFPQFATRKSQNSRFPDIENALRKELNCGKTVGFAGSAESETIHS